MLDTNLYILKHRKPVLCPDVKKWGKRFNDFHKRRVRSTYLDDIWISTVFLGVDHNFDSGPPLLFETMVFKDSEEIDCNRCATWREALRIHHYSVDLYKATR